VRGVELGLEPVVRPHRRKLPQLERNVRWVAAAGGQVVPELDCRHGRRLAKRKVRRKVSRKSRSALR